MRSRATKNHVLDYGSGRNARAYGIRLIELLQFVCIAIGLFASYQSYADQRMSIAVDPKGYISLVGHFQDGSQIKTTIDRGDFFYGWYSREHGYIGCAQRASAKGSVCGKTSGEQREIRILSINVEHDSASTECTRERNDDFNVYYRCPHLKLPEPICVPRDEGGWKYADCELISDDIIRLLYISGIDVRIENLYAQKGAVNKYNDGFRDSPIKVPYEIPGENETLERWIRHSCCVNGEEGLFLDEKPQPVEESVTKVEQPEPVAEKSAPQVEPQASEQESNVATPFPHKKIRMMALTSAGAIIFLVLLVVGTAYMRSRK